jgi:hypothetical protein
MPSPASIAEFSETLLRKLKENPFEVTPIIEQLRCNTAVEGLIEPQNEEHQFQTWLEIIRALFKDRLIYQATRIADAWYDRISELQAQNRLRYHKGGVAHQLGNCHLSQGESACAVWFFTMAFIEDALSGRTPELKPTAATNTLRTNFNWSDSIFQTIATTTQALNRVKPELCRYPEAIVVDLARQQKLVLPLAKGDENIPINRPFLNQLIGNLETESNDSKKKSLEFLASYLAISLPNVKIVPNARTLDHEMDIVVIQQSSSPTYLLEALGRSFLIECKNWETTVGVEQLNHFVAKMRFHRCRCGVIFSPEGISGQRQATRSLQNARLTQLRWYQQDECVVIVIAMSHLKEMVNGFLNFADILLRGYESIRFGVSEDSITSMDVG